MSSTCRACGEYFKIKDGKAVSNKPGPINPFGDKGVPTPAAIREKAPEPEGPKAVTEEEALVAPLTRTPASRETTRDIDCPECGRSHSARPNGTSSLCPHCGFSISLRNYEIFSNWNKDIETRGEVFVCRDGHVQGATIRSHNLSIEGRFEGTVDCSNELNVSGDLEPSGELKCGHLNVGRDAQLHLDYPARIKQGSVNGTVRGNIICEGRLILEENAVIHGNLTVGALVVHAGAHHTGEVHMSSPSLTDQVSTAMAKED